MKYELFDDYDGYAESLGVFDTKKEAKHYMREYEQETDGECHCYLVRVKED